MSESKPDARTEWWGGQLSEVDRELARLATICGVRLLDPGVIERVLKKDMSVCSTKNQLAFDKLHTVLMVHYAVMDKTLDQLGGDQTTALINGIVARLRERFGDQLGGRS